MIKRPRVLVLRTAGTNCDKETAFAFEKVGAAAELVHINQLVEGRKLLQEYAILALPGGFSYGDDIAAGKILANEIRFQLKDQIVQFLRDGKLIIGICNGFQILVKSGLLPGNEALKQEVSLIINDSGKFEDRWVYLKTRTPGHQDTRTHVGERSQVTGHKAQGTGTCVWTKGLPEVIYLPVAHGEGKFVAADEKILERLRKNGQIVFQYCDEKGGFSGYPVNPNGSADHIAGICDGTGRILGLMPHPERHIDVFQHPRWTRMKTRPAEGDGLQIFRNGVEYVKKFL
jgi:phosphoribosylformylglycinamidine synthase